MADFWYACRCEPGKTLALAEALKGAGIEVECPTFTFRRRVPRRKRVETLERPLIGGMFFLGADCWPLRVSPSLRIDVSQLRRVQTPNGPALIRDEELDGLRVAAGEVSEDRREIKPGNSIEFCTGPLKGRVGKVIAAGHNSIRAEVDGLPGTVTVAPFLLRKIPA